MLKRLKKSLGRNLINVFGTKVFRRYIVFESDDWGTVRMPSVKAREAMVKSGIDSGKNPFNQFDTLEQAADLEALFELLGSIKDQRGHSPIITANTILGNPDFEKIQASNFQSYFSEPFTETYQRYYGGNQTWERIKEGINAGFWMPQFHGLEHINVPQWLHELRNGNPHYTKAFEWRLFGVEMKRIGAKRTNLMAAFDFENKDEQNYNENRMRLGLRAFHDTFGFESESCIAPCNVWHPSSEAIWNEMGVKYIQGLYVQFKPDVSEKYGRIRHYQGQKNKHGQHYLVRNSFFEPSTQKNYQWVEECLLRIHTAFVWKKPAVVSVHRLNFIGGLEEHNRTNNLAMFKTLLQKILKQWPDAEFISSPELGRIITQTNT